MIKQVSVALKLVLMFWLNLWPRASFSLSEADSMNISFDPPLRLDSIEHVIADLESYISWGLGVGIQHSRQGDCIWHWGSNPGSKSVMVIYPTRGLGVVVMTNCANTTQLAFEIAGRAIGGKVKWGI